MSAHWYLTFYKNKISNTFYGDGIWKCSNCKTSSIEINFPERERYCHNCGLRMDEQPELIVKNDSKYVWE